MAVDEIRIGGAADIEDVGRAHAHPAPFETVGDRVGKALALRIVNEGAERSLTVVVVVALEFEIADDSVGALAGPVRQHHDIIAIETLGVAAFGLDDDRAVNARLFLEAGMAVVPVGTTLTHGEAVDEGFARRDTGKAEAGHAIHRRGRAHAVPVDRRRFAEAIGDGKGHGIAFAPAQDRSRDLAVNAGRRDRPAGDVDRHGSDFELELGPAEDRCGRGECTAQGPRQNHERAGRSGTLQEAAAGKGGDEGIHRPPPAGVIALISYMPPGCCSIVKLTRVPGLIGLRSTDGATGNSIVIAGQPISGMGWWLRLTLCCAGSTALTVPVPCASFWPACAICISPLCAEDAPSASACMA